MHRLGLRGAERIQRPRVGMRRRKPRAASWSARWRRLRRGPGSDCLADLDRSTERKAGTLGGRLGLPEPRLLGLRVPVRAGAACPLRGHLCEELAVELPGLRAPATVALGEDGIEGGAR